MYKFPLLNGVTVVILANFGEMPLDFSVCNNSKNYAWYIDTCTDIYKISQSGFFSSTVYHLNVDCRYIKNRRDCHTITGYII